MKKVKAVKAKVVDDGFDYEVIVWATNSWRCWFTPYRKGSVRGYNKASDARRGAERVAKELGIKLEWVRNEAS